MIGAILQPGYMPWIGFFEQMALSDVFVVLDDVPYDKDGWRNRNRILLGGAPAWLTVPVRTRGRTGQLIRDVVVDREQPWLERHRRTLHHAYSGRPGRDAAAEVLEGPELEEADLLATIDGIVTERIRAALDLRARIVSSSDLTTTDDRNGRLVDICRQLGVTHYLSGQAAKSYLDVGAMAAAGVEVLWHEHTPRAYPQRADEFVPRLSAIDLIANVGAEAAGDIIREGAHHE